MTFFMRIILVLLALPVLLAPQAQAQTGPLRIEITEGVIEPLPFAVPNTARISRG